MPVATSVRGTYLFIKGELDRARVRSGRGIRLTRALQPPKAGTPYPPYEGPNPNSDPPNSLTLTLSQAHQAEVRHVEHMKPSLLVDCCINVPIPIRVRFRGSVTVSISPGAGGSNIVDAGIPPNHEG